MQGRTPPDGTAPTRRPSAGVPEDGTLCLVRFDNGDVSVNVEAAGPEDGPAVLFIHGLSGSAESFGWLPEEVTAERRVLRMDLRGHGLSDRAPGGYVIDAYARDAEVVLEALGRPAVVVGHSLGAVTAWTVAQRRRDLVVAALLEDPPLYFGEPEEFAGQAPERAFPIMRQAIIGMQAEGIDQDEWRRRAAGLPWGPDRTQTLGDVLCEDAVRAMALNQSRVDPDTILAACDTTTLGGTDTASPVSVPVLLLRADADREPAFFPKHAARLQASHPDVEIVEIAGAGHQISSSRAHRDRYVALLTEFLDRYSPTA